MDFPARDNPALSFSLSTSSFSLLRALAFSVSLSFSFSFSVSVFSLTLSPFLFHLFLSLSFYLFSRMVLTRNFPRCVSRGSSREFFPFLFPFPFLPDATRRVAALFAVLPGLPRIFTLHIFLVIRYSYTRARDLVKTMGISSP